MYRVITALGAVTLLGAFLGMGTLNDVLVALMLMLGGIELGLGELMNLQDE